MGKVSAGTGVLGPLLIALGSDGSPLPNEYKPWALYAGVALVVVFLIALFFWVESRGGHNMKAQTSGPNSPVTQVGGDNAGGDIAKDGGSITKIYATPPPAAVPHAHVQIDVMNNGASEHGLRWFHLRAFTTTSVLAKGATIRVNVSGGAGEHWQWAGCHDSFTIGQQGHEIPLVAGTFPAFLVPLQVGWRLLPRFWYLTPVGHAAPGRRIMPFTPNAVLAFEVTVSWPEGDEEAWSRVGVELQQDDTGNDAWTVKVSESDSFSLTQGAS